MDQKVKIKVKQQSLMKNQINSHMLTIAYYADNEICWSGFILESKQECIVKAKTEII